MSADGGNFFAKIHDFVDHFSHKPQPKTLRAPKFTASYHYDTGVWAILTRDDPDNPPLCVGKTG